MQRCCFVARQRAVLGWGRYRSLHSSPLLLREPEKDRRDIVREKGGGGEKAEEDQHRPSCAAPGRSSAHRAAAEEHNKVPPGGGRVSWTCKHTWRRAGINTSWCLLGCSIGEFLTLATFQWYGVSEVTAWTIALPVVNGLATSVALETAILAYGASNLRTKDAFETAMRMSFASMVAMELSMEATDVMLTGGLAVQPAVVPAMLAAGWLVPLPYNYYRLKKYGKACH